MQPLPNFEPQSTPSTPKTDPKAAANWVYQMISCFPPPSPTQEILKSIVLVFCQYRESTLREIVSPISGLPSEFKYLPSIKEINDFCKTKSSEIEQDKLRAIAHEKLVRAQIGSPRDIDKEIKDPCYWGPIEDVKPGDVLHWSRLAEYDHFAKSKLGFDPGRPRGFFEKWVDTGRRPFAASQASSLSVPVAPPAGHSIEKNPFE